MPTAGAQSLTLSAAPTANDYKIGFLWSANDTNDKTYEGSGWTEVYDIPGPENPAEFSQQLQVITGTTSTAVAWTDVSYGGISYAVGGAGMVVAAASESSLSIYISECVGSEAVFD